jgi:transposase
MPEAGEPKVDVWVGLDVGKTSHFATVLSDTGEQLLARPVANDEADLVVLLQEAAQHGCPALVIDQPGSIGHLVVAVAAEHRVPVAYVPGLVMRRAADLYPGEAKTDPKDSFVLADTARTHRSRVHWLAASDEVLEELRILAGYDEDLAHDATRLSNRLRDALTAMAPALERTIGDRLGVRAVRALLIRYPTPTALHKAGRTRIRTLLTRHSPRIGERLTDEVMAALDAQTVTVPAEATLGRVIGELAADLDGVRDRRDHLEKEMERVLLAHPFGPVVLTLPGVGKKTGARILAQIGDISQFPTAGHLASYAGLAPVTRQSGKSVRGERRSVRGNRCLKNALYFAAFNSIRSSEASKAYYTRKRAEGKRHTSAVLCLARRRCDVLHAMLTSGKPYRQVPSAPQAA